MKAFSLLELLLALTITLIVGAVGFELFRLNEHTFQTQNDASGIQQSARAVIFQINDEIRRAGQGVPVYSSTFDSSPAEATSTVLTGSDAAHLRIRAGYSNVQADVLTTPANYVLNMPQTLSVSDAASFYNGLGTTTPTAQFAYVWGSGANCAVNVVIPNPL